MPAKTGSGRDPKAEAGHEGHDHGAGGHDDDHESGDHTHGHDDDA